MREVLFRQVGLGEPAYSLGGGSNNKTVGRIIA
jgi:hypothetical protein